MHACVRARAEMYASSMRCTYVYVRVCPDRNVRQRPTGICEEIQMGSYTHNDVQVRVHE